MKALSRKLIFVVASNFCFFAALAALMPFHVLYMKQSGIKASEIGVMNGVTPILGTIGSIWISSLADKYKAHKIITQVFLLLTGLSFSLFLAVPTDDIATYNQESRCLETNFSQTKPNLARANKSTYLSPSAALPCVFNGSTIQSNRSDGCKPCKEVNSTFSDDNRSMSFEVSGSVQFWGFFVLRLLGFMFFQPAFALHTTLSLRATRGNENSFAQTRALGNVGFLVAACVLSVINQFCPPPAFLKQTFGLNYFACAIIGDLLLIGAAVFLQYYDILRVSKETNKDKKQDIDASQSNNDSKSKSDEAKSRSGLSHCLRNPSVTCMIVMLFVSGVLGGAYENYLLWYVEDMQPVALFWAAFLAVAIISDIGITWVSGRIVRRIGEPNCIIVAFVAYAVRFGVTGFLRTPWPLLVVQALNGFTFGLNFVAYTTFLTRHAPPNLIATIQSIALTAYMGFGFAIGGFLGGVIWSSFGSRALFFSGAVFSVAIAAIYAAVQHCLIRRCFSSASPQKTLRSDASDNRDQRYDAVEMNAESNEPLKAGQDEHKDDSRLLVDADPTSNSMA